MKFSPEEFKDILISIAISTMIFSFSVSITKFLSFLPIAFISVAVSTFLAIIAFKYVAEKLRLKAFFKLWTTGSVIGLVAMLIQPIKLVPTFNIMIYHERFSKWKKKYTSYAYHTEPTIKEVGMATVISPVVNLALAIFSWFILTVSFPENFFLAFFSMVNGWMALSSLIPIKSLPGSKIFVWKPWFWFLLVVFSIIVLGFSVQVVY